jgi:outer membrane receptor protein involved in Fe transport
MLVMLLETPVLVLADEPQSDDALSGRLKEVVVTATRKEESLSKVPVSVVALGKAEMDEQGVHDIGDIARLAPCVSLLPLRGQDISGTGRTISMRGISSNVGAATTGVYIDDTPTQVRALSNDTTNVYPEVFDLDRVEVLYGLQGTLFGAGAEGGAVRFITTQPSLTDFSTYARSEGCLHSERRPQLRDGRRNRWTNCAERTWIFE